MPYAGLEGSGLNIDGSGLDTSALMPPAPAMPAGGGLGIVGDAGASPEPASSPFGRPASRQPVVDGKKNPLRALGAVLLNINRGMTGQPLYTDELKKQQQEDQILEMQQGQAGIQALKSGMELIKNTPSAQREEVLKQFGAIYDHIVPGLSGILQTAAKTPEVTGEQIQALGEHAKLAIATFGGVPEAMKGIALHPEIVKQWDANTDRNNAPYIAKAFSRSGQIIESNPDARAAIESAAQDGWTLSDLADPIVAGAMGLNDSMIQTLRRSPDLQRELSKFGFVPEEDSALKAKKAIEKIPLSEKAAEAGAEATARENAQVVNYVGPDGTIESATKGQRDAMKARGFQPFTSGRTPTDKEADAIMRARGKNEGERQSKLNPFIAGLTGESPEMTNQEFIDKGGNPTIDEPTTRKLQDLKASYGSGRDMIGNVRAIVMQNPNANTRVAAFQGVANNLVQEVKAFTEATGVKTPDIDTKVRENEAVFKRNGIDNALMKQAVVSLAYMQSAAFGQSGHSASNRDIEQAAKAIGGKNADPEQLLALIDQAEVNFDNTYRENVNAATNIKPPSEIGDVSDAEDLVQAGADGGISKEEYMQRYQGLSRRAKLRVDSLLSSGRLKKKRKD